MNDLIAKAKQSLKDWDFEIEGDDLDYHFVADIIGGMVVDIHVHFDSVEFTPASRENHGDPWNTETIDAYVEFGEAKIMSAIIKNGESIVGALTDFDSPAMRVIVGAVGCFAREAVMDANGCDKAGGPMSSRYLWSIGSYAYRGAIWTGREWSFDRQTQPKYYPTLAEAMAALETIDTQADAYIRREL